MHRTKKNKKMKMTARKRRWLIPICTEILSIYPAQLNAEGSELGKI